jgi:predicted neuraminidase
VNELVCFNRLCEIKMVRFIQYHLLRGVMAGFVVAGCLSQNPVAGAEAKMPASDAIVKRAFISENPPFRSSHASTIVQTRSGAIMAAWFGGTAERNRDVSIWTARFDGGKWSAPAKVAEGIQADGQTRHPCWNPVLFQPKTGPLLLFYKVGPSPDAWWGMLRTSADDGQTWSAPRRLPENQVGPVRNKPVSLADGSLLCGASTENHGWRIHIERTPDLGATWERTPPINDGKEFAAIQPTILQWPAGKTQILVRTKQGCIAESWMGDDWKSWSPLKKTALPNPNSAIDGLVLADGRALLIYNQSSTARSPINAAVSHDGREWLTALTLEQEPGSEFSYPAVIQASNGLVHVTYTWKRQRIRHVILDPRKLRE